MLFFFGCYINCCCYFSSKSGKLFNDDKRDFKVCFLESCWFERKACNHSWLQLRNHNWRLSELNFCLLDSLRIHLKSEFEFSWQLSNFTLRFAFQMNLSSFFCIVCNFEARKLLKNGMEIAQLRPTTICILRSLTSLVLGTFYPF